MGMQNDLRAREEVIDLLDLCNALEELYRRRVQEAQAALDGLLRDRDWAKERLFVLDHDYQEGA